MARTGRKSTVKFQLCKELVILVAVIVAMIVTTIVLSIPSHQGLTNVSKVNEAVLADIGTGARLWLHYGAGMRLFIADNSQLGRLHTAW